MDRPWHLDNYTPTLQTRQNKWVKTVTSEECSIDNLQKRVRLLTRQMRDTPHNPLPMIARAQCLLLLQFPELAVADAHKASQLFSPRATVELKTQAMLQHGFSIAYSHQSQLFEDLPYREQWEDWRIPVLTSSRQGAESMQSLTHLYQIARRFLIIALHLTNAYEDALAECLLSIEDFGATTDPSNPWSSENVAYLRTLLQKKQDATSAAFPDDKAAMNLAMKNGNVRARAYPWMQDEELGRPASLMSEFPRNSIQLKAKGLEIKPCAFAPNEFGLFAARGFAREETIGEERAQVCASMAADRCVVCCSLSQCSRFCSEACARLAGEGGSAKEDEKSDPLASLHCNIKPDAQNEHRRSEVHEYLMTSRLYTQMLNTLPAQQSPLTHFPLLSRLRANYTGDVPRPFNYQRDVVYPLAVLTALGADIWCDARLDFWILWTMKLRVDNNHMEGLLRGGKFFEGVFPVISMMNHSCEPNVALRDDQSGAKVLIARRDVSAGEELNITYMQQGGLAGDRGMRTQQLAPWLGVECRSARCVVER